MQFSKSPPIFLKYFPIGYTINRNPVNDYWKWRKSFETMVSKALCETDISNTNALEISQITQTCSERWTFCDGPYEFSIQGTDSKWHKMCCRKISQIYLTCSRLCRSHAKTSCAILNRPSPDCYFPGRCKLEGLAVYSGRWTLINQLILKTSVSRRRILFCGVHQP